MNSDLPDPVTPSEEPAAAAAAPVTVPEAAPVTVPEAAPATESTPEVPADAAPVAAAPAPAAPVADATAELKALFPALFTGKPKPVKLRIQADIQERAQGKFSKAQLSAFLRRYTGSTGYLIALTQAKTRFDLDGQPAGEITEEHLKAAQEELARRRGLKQEREQADQERHQLEAQQRRNRAQLLWDFERTTLTEANFCVLKGTTPEELPGLLEIARKERAEAPPAPPREARRDGPPPRRDDRRPGGGGRPEGRNEGRREGGRPPQRQGQGRKPDQPRRDQAAKPQAPKPPATAEAQPPKDQTPE
ncbi:ProQ/FINO family protein [Roseateles sp. NT4]|uniref:ProQ/FINO family protein n=1 Tax=Roseateles sp. NT4 TaxID=3453715 RepID=UPI003EE95965